MATYLGLTLLVGALVAALLGLRQLRLWLVLRRVEVTTPGQLLDSVRAGRLDPGLRAVVGSAAVGSAGRLTSAVNQVPCVWHRHVIEHQQVRYLTNSKGRRHRSTIYSTDRDTSSQEPFRLVGPTGEIEVRPAAMRIDRPAEAQPRTRSPDRRGGLRSLPKDGRTAHIYRHREWIIEAGAPLFVLGEVTRIERGAHDAEPGQSRPPAEVTQSGDLGITESTGPRLVLRRPARGPHVISTRDGRHLLRRFGWSALVSLILAVGLAVTGGLLASCGDLPGVLRGVGLT